MSKTKLPADFSGVHFHFVGIKGTGMAALVEIFHARGAVITGSDVSERFYTDEVLEKLGIKALPFDSRNINDEVQYVIYSSAYSAEKNPDLAEAKKRGLPMLLYTQALGALSETAFSSGVCGVHGKTTTTGIVGTLLKATGIPSQVLAGSIIASFGNSCTMTNLPSGSEAGEKPLFVAETCEYQRHFMDFSPKKIILTSVESDHQDYYPTFADIQEAFVDYIMKLPESGDLIYCADDKGASETAAIAFRKRPDLNLIPYGTEADGDFKIEFGKVLGGKQYFKIKALGEFALCVPGSHNVRNATAAVALVIRLLSSVGKNPLDYTDKIKAGLENFSGGKRRSEIVGRAKTPLGQDVIFIDDYGHHPTAINTTLSGYKEFYKGYKLIVDFMSHTYTRTQALLEEFASSFAAADDVIINKIYASARETPDATTVTGEILAEKAKRYHKSVYYAKEFDEAAKLGTKLLSKDCSEEFPNGYIFVTMGAGDNWKVGKMILDELSGEK
ncbi:MAG: UDP-N-acetylmuramate--L-alanine ligase [Treponema sp.]|nr:UDP-N-acetylmuramate--L-alanine ligase [Treponema sp.]